MYTPLVLKMGNDIKKLIIPPRTAENTNVRKIGNPISLERRAQV
tara:strand:+ start:622 stop:753 length:132 start_codon:yes stop_codon:yes gene_type:complete